MRSARASAIACAAALLLAGAAHAANPALTLVYQGGGAFTLTLGNGTPVASGSVIAPGVYDFVLDIEGPDPLLQLSGPGFVITYSEYASTSFTRNLIPNSTYTLADGNTGGRVIVFRTGDAASGTATTPTAAPPTGAPESNGSVIGSALATSAGTLDTTLAAVGAPTLTRRGKPVTRLPHGRYTLTLSDRSRAAGLELGKANGPLRALSSRSFVGTRKVAVVLTPGRWTLSAGRTGQRSFVVT